MVSKAQVLEIMRNVTGRVDATDPLFTDPIMTRYLNDFIVQQSSIDVRLFKNYTWWEFTIDDTSLDPYPVNLETITLVNGVTGASTISDPAYISGPDFPSTLTPSSLRLNWFQDPGQFYAKWPPFQVFTTQRPTDVLYFNNELTFRGPVPPDVTYTIKIQAYSEEVQFTNAEDGTVLSQPPDYLYRYLAYGASLDIFSDYGEMDKYSEIFPVFRKYRGLVQARTWQQFITQRTAPQW